MLSQRVGVCVAKGGGGIEPYIPVPEHCACVFVFSAELAFTSQTDFTVVC